MTDGISKKKKLLYCIRRYVYNGPMITLV